MRFTDRYPLIVTSKKDECSAFWTEKMGFEVGFDSSWFVWLQAPDQGASIAFMTPDHPSAPPGSDEFTGKGITFEVDVDDVDAAYEELRAAGVPISYELTDEPFGQRRFGFHDPSGLWIDIVQQIEPAAGFWDRYMV